MADKIIDNQTVNAQFENKNVALDLGDNPYKAMQQVFNVAAAAVGHASNDIEDLKGKNRLLDAKIRELKAALETAQAEKIEVIANNETLKAENEELKKINDKILLENKKYKDMIETLVLKTNHIAQVNMGDGTQTIESTSGNH